MKHFNFKNFLIYVRNLTLATSAMIVLVAVFLGLLMTNQEIKSLGFLAMSTFVFSMVIQSILILMDNVKITVKFN